MTRRLGEFAADCGGTLHGADAAFAAVSTDTRSVGRGELFVALRGPRFDGAAFVSQALAAGAAGAVVEASAVAAMLAPQGAARGPGGAVLPLIAVDDTQLALQRAANAWRRRFAIPVIGVAGSNGKTTCKEMIAAILAQGGPVLSTRGNLNNHIGVPLTLLRLDATHRHAVIEMGANRAGDVAELVRFALPGIGIVTNAGAEHLEGFGSLEGVARAEGEMFAGLEADGIAVVNVDDAFAPLWRGMTRARIVGFGLDAAADFRAVEVATSVGADGFRTRFALISPQGRASVELRLAGMHNVGNALGAAAAAVSAGASLEQVAAGLGAMRPVPGRLNFRTARSGAWVIDDSYNANPSSMLAGIDVLADLDGRRWLVIGDMAELGEFAADSHAEIGRYARERGIERLYATGTLAGIAVERFGAGARWFPDGESLARTLDAELEAGVRVLVKGSRVNRLERVVETIAPAGGGTKTTQVG
ncbi:MAG: UDP-N-acetylmuramoyl-tripeptide--D-alanyl-D-alanine ligase [Gammaproteobacteria bacterium]|nr:UDP-N-acetylmuramoyl-tripeptide--D-alanyl-D-alanine ligase [Gammaproteobacteria bacterium]